MRAPLAALLADGLPVLGTCAGMILLAREVVDGRPDQESFGAVDVAVHKPQAPVTVAFGDVVVRVHRRREGP